jgi:tetratricopeptide (TPR) repeat protein
MDRRAAVIVVFLLLTGACTNAPVGTLSAIHATQALPAPSSDPKSRLTLDQIPPPLSLPTARPTTQPDVPAPVESLALYAAARDALLDGRPWAAVDLFHKAIALDPDSFELYRGLGQAQLAALRHPNPAEIDSFQKALELRPDDLHLRALLGAQYASLGQQDKAVEQLRLALLTPQYQEDDVAAATVDFVLARLLQDQGYDRAALDEYAILLHRLDDPSFALRSQSELATLADNPRSLLLDMAYLHEKLGQWSDALDIYRPLAQDDPANFELQAKIVRLLSYLGKTQDAITAAAQVDTIFAGSSDAQNLIKEVARRGGVDGIAALRLLSSQHPADPSLTNALTDLLVARGRLADAQNVLEQSPLTKTPQADRQVVGKLFDLYLRQDRVDLAARLLIVYLAANPDSLGQIDSWWQQLLEPSRSDALTLSTLQHLDVPPGTAAAKEFLVWRLADQWRRDVLARSALDQAAQSTPDQRPFAPAIRQLVITDWSRSNWSEAQKQSASDALAAAAEKSGDPSLAAEVRGLAALSEHQPAQAATAFEQALALGGSSPQLLLTYAAALRADKQDIKAQQLLWQLVSQYPQYDQAWESLFQFELNQKAVEESRKVLVQWLAAIPSSVPARIFEAEIDQGQGNFSQAETNLLKLFNDHPDNADVISALLALGRNTGRTELFVQRLSQLHLHEPANVVVAEWLVEIYADEDRMVEGKQVLDETRRAVSGDLDLLYRIAHLYERVDQKQVTEEVLKQIVAADPQQASACNDLGYTWADEGIHLPKAQALIQVAIDQEPDNESFLDSMGWVLYKQKQYSQAAVYFDRAIGPANQPDPLVLNHYGDVLYRWGKIPQAAAQWDRALAGVDSESQDPDQRQLRFSLLQKIQSLRLGREADVAPLGTDSK